MSDKREIRSKVAETYARAASQTPCGCGPSGPSSCAVTQAAGYRPQDVKGLPAGAASSSFGCGNPLAFADVQPGEVVLDLGSGAGLDLLIAAKRVGPTGQVIGVDMTDEMIARARGSIAEARLTNAEVRKGLIEDLPVESSSVDWVISNCVINLSPDKPRVFAEIARVLRPGGHMIVWDMVVRDLPAWVRQDENLYCACIAGAISEEDYVRGLRQGGLVDVMVRERITYDVNQIAEFLQSELSGSSCCCGPPAGDLRTHAASLTGSVWSACFAATKPG
jgi:arsenite methyltransferase